MFIEELYGADPGVNDMYVRKSNESKVDNTQRCLEKDSTSVDASNRRVLPSLSALRAFEAAARYRNFSTAAQELNVTTSAVSHQVRSLETWLDKQLFNRNARPLSLTQAGAVYFHAVSEAFDRVADTTRQMLGHSTREILTVSTMHSFAASWLIPKLEQFRKAHTWLDVRVLTNSRFLDLKREECDVAVRYGKGQWPGTVAELLLEDRRLPVCSPALFAAECAEGFKLERQTLIHDGSRPGWNEWFHRDAGSGIDRTMQGMFFTHSYLAVQAAARGYGVALVSEPLVAEAIACGDLACPSPRTLRGSGAYYLVTASGLERQGKTRTFCDWLMAEARTHCAEV